MMTPRFSINRVLLLCILLLLPLLGGCGDEKAVADLPAPSRAYKVMVETVTPRPIRDVLVLPGATEADGDVTLSAERSGRVEWIGPHEGETVKADQLIAKIDLSSLEASLFKARASFRLAEKQADRRSDLEDKAVVSREELDEALTELKLAQGNLREAEVAYRQGTIRSPIRGVVNTLHVDPGEYVDTGAPVAEVVNLDTVRVNVDVPEMDIRYLHKDDSVRVTVDAYPERVWQGRVQFVSMKADTSTKTFRVRVIVDNADRTVRPGMLARAAFMRRSVDAALTVPLLAVQDKGGERIVFVVENGHAAARTITPGVIDGDRVQVLDGVKAGDKIIVSGQNEVEDGSEVTVQ